MASARQQIRIAIALAALRHKPSTQSILAYILDLQSAFPVSAPEGDPNRLPSPNPWRQRVLLLEKDLQDLQSQYDKEKIELLSLRKAAIARSKETKKRTRETESVEDTADSSATRKKGRQKRQKPVPVVCATDGAAPPTPEKEPRPQSRPGLGAIAGGLFVSADTPIVPAFLASLDSFDAMADMLDGDALAVPLDLLLSTTRHALRTLGALLSACFASSTQACSLSVSSCGSSSSPTSRTGISFVSMNSRNWAGAASGVRDPLRALGLLDASLIRVLRTVFSSLPAHFPEGSAEVRGPQQSAQMQTRAALDDVLGCLYTLVLAPLVRAFAPASEGFVSACLGSGFCSGSGLGFGSGSGISYGEEYPLPGSGGNSHSDNDSAMADLRPVLFDVLERTLSVLELEGQSLGVGLGLGSSGAGTDPIAGESSSRSDPAGNGDGGHTSKGMGLQAIPGVREVKRLLALDCVRELERMYSYTPAAPPSAAETSDPSTDTNIRRGSDVPPGGSGDTRQGEGSQRHSLPRELLALWPGSARTCARKAHGWNADANRNRDREGSGGASEDPTRPGTAASRAITTGTNPALGPLRVQDQDRVQASATGLTGAAGPPRSAGNLGEIRVAGGGRDLVRGASSDDAAEGAAPVLGFAHAQGRSARREREERGGEDLDLRGENGLGKRFTARTVRLARKDAAWYLCAVLNRLLSGSAAATPSNVGVELAAGSGSNRNASFDASRPRTEDVDNANANVDACAKSVNPNPKLWLTNKDSDDTDTVADEAVYAALVDLLRRTRPAPSSFLPGGRGGSGNCSDSSTRTDTVEAPIHDDGSSTGGADRHERQHTRGGELETVAMGEVERGMLLAVFERAWLGT